MQLQIKLSSFYDNEAYFEITTEEGVFYTSKMISNLLNLNLTTYNRLLIEKVIKHEDFAIDQYTKDVSFMINNIPKETYIERFKDIFIKEITLLTLGGESIEN